MRSMQVMFHSVDWRITPGVGVTGGGHYYGIVNTVCMKPNSLAHA